MKIDKQTLHTIRVELANMQKIVNDAEAKLKKQQEIFFGLGDQNLNGTQESSTLQAQFKVMKYNIGKLYRP